MYINDFPYSVSIPPFRTGDKSSRLEWCSQNVGRGGFFGHTDEADWLIDFTIPSGPTYHFKNVEDAIIFKLKFG